METTNLNATLDCIKETTNVMNRIIINVCDGTVTSIPIGFWDFMGGIVLALFSGFILLSIYKILKS